MTDDVKEGVKKIFIESFPELRNEKFDIGKKQSDFRDWDSFMQMKLISEMEERFKVTLPIEKTIDADSPSKFMDIIRDAITTQPTASDDDSDKDFKNYSDALDHWAQVQPDKTFLVTITAQARYSYSEFNTLVNRCSHLLKKRGLRKGDTVLLSVRNSIELLIVYFATMRMGAIINLVPSSVGDKELLANIAFLKPKIAFIEEKYAKRRKKGIYAMEFGDGGLIGELSTLPDEAPQVALKYEDPACLYYSSGTTANPKGILFSHRGIINMAKLLSREFGHDRNSVHLGILPMGHTSVMHHSLLPVLYKGGTFVFSENFINIRKDFWRIVESFRVTYVQTVPTIIVMLNNTPYPLYQKKKLQLPFVACGSAPLPESSKKEFEKKFRLRIANLYGLSEAAHMIDDYPFEVTWKPGMLGRPMEDVDVKIFDEKGHEVGPNIVGEMVVKSPSLCIGYYKNEKLFRSSFKRGYFCTGDLAYKDTKGIFYFSGRKKDLIIKGGVNISPNLIDEILVKHPSIEEAASVGKHDAFFGETIKSFVVLRNGKKISQKEFFAYCKNKLGSFKSPSEVEFVDAIPKTFSGKVLRRSLRGKKN